MTGIVLGLKFLGLTGGTSSSWPLETFGKERSCCSPPFLAIVGMTGSLVGSISVGRISCEVDGGVSAAAGDSAATTAAVAARTPSFELLTLPSRDEGTLGRASTITSLPVETDEAGLATDSMDTGDDAVSQTVNQVHQDI